MAIGSGAEIGVVFGQWKDLTEQQRDWWCSTLRERWGDSLLDGYGNLAYPRRWPNGEKPNE